jgi:hypothetical protein
MMELLASLRVTTPAAPPTSRSEVIPSSHSCSTSGMKRRATSTTRHAPPGGPKRTPEGAFPLMKGRAGLQEPSPCTYAPLLIFFGFFGLPGTPIFRCSKFTSRASKGNLGNSLVF